MTLPYHPERIHLMGICGTGMGAFAGLLKQAGYDVRGSDQGVYPPMSDQLAAWGIEVRSPYGPDNLDGPVPDLVVVGNVIPKVNVEATAMRERDLPHASFPQTLGDIFLKDKHSVVVAGTHGKTTTSTLLAHTLFAAGRDPGFLIGGIPQNFSESFRVGGRKPGTPFVVEGDEYDTAYFDKGPKFLHYQAKSLLITSLEFDHADIYDDVAQIEARFEQLCDQMNESGHIVAQKGAASVWRVLQRAKIDARVETYGEADADFTPADVVEDETGLTFCPVVKGQKRGALKVELSGAHGVQNALGAYAICLGLGLDHDEIVAGFATFAGVKRRMEHRGEVGGVLVVDDFAHHPTAVETTLAGAKKRYPHRPVWALFEPRSATSCRKIFQDEYARAFDAADRVLLAPPGRKLPPDEALDMRELAANIAKRGTPAQACESIDAMVDVATDEAAKPAVLLCMSNGSFGGIHERLLDALRVRGQSHDS